MYFKIYLIYIFFILSKKQGCRTNQRMMFTPPPLTVASVFKKLTEIAKMSGHSVSS